MICFTPILHEDVDALIAQEALSTMYPWSMRNLSDSLDASADCYLIRSRDVGLGYCVVNSVLDEAELLNLVIFKPFQSRGYGAEVMQELKQKLADSGIKNWFLEVRASNTIAKSLYEKSGFIVLNTRRNYYRTSKQMKEDAFLMQCLLP